MDFTTCNETRRSVRKYLQKPIDEALLHKIIAAASCAPSWKNSQTTRYIAVQSNPLKEILADTCMLDFKPNQQIVRNAPMVILVTTVANRSGYERDGSFSTGKGTHWESFDAGIAAQTLCLSAHNEGLGTVIMGIFDAEKVAEAAHIPPEQKLSAMVAVGYPDEQPSGPKRKEFQELLTVL